MYLDFEREFEGDGRHQPIQRGILALTGLAMALVLLMNVVPMFQSGAAAALPSGEPIATVSPAPNDRQAPTIRGVRDREVYVGKTLAYKDGVDVIDDTDPEPVLTVDVSLVNLSAPGTYAVTYTATDAAGNSAQTSCQVNVKPLPEDYASSEEILKAADEVLEEIVHSRMTDRQKVEAIYTWAHSAFTYAGHSDRTDWEQTAYQMLKSRSGDCFGYFSATKLLLQRLGYATIDVEKYRTDDSQSHHYWSLVSIDGGQTYYHFDATPRVGQTQSLCLVTDAILNAFSLENDGSHNRDISRYPATPEA